MKFKIECDYTSSSKEPVELNITVLDDRGIESFTHNHNIVMTVRGLERMAKIRLKSFIESLENNINECIRCHCLIESYPSCKEVEE